MVFVMDDTLSILRPIHLPVLQTRMKNMLPMQEFALDYFERLVKIDPNLDISLEVSTRFSKPTIRLQREWWFFTFFDGPQREAEFTPLVFAKIEYRKKRYFQKAYENHIN